MSEWFGFIFEWTSLFGKQGASLYFYIEEM